MENPELLLLELEEFNRTSNSQDDQVPQNLENFIEYVSKTGTYIFPWSLVKKLFLKKLTNIVNNLQSCMSLSTSDLNVSSSSTYTSNQNTANDANSIQLIKDRIFERMRSFNNAPFTIQRICELLLKPNNHYNRIDKYLRGLEKCVMVVTTVDPSGNKIFMENSMTNGISTSNPSTPLITPTRSTTPPAPSAENNQSESAPDDSLVLTTPTKQEPETEGPPQEALPSPGEPSTTSNLTTPPKSLDDNTSTENLTKSEPTQVAESSEINSVEVKIEEPSLASELPITINATTVDTSSREEVNEMETSEQKTPIQEDCGNTEMAIGHQELIEPPSENIKSEINEAPSENMSNKIDGNDQAETSMETEAVKTEDVLVNTVETDAKVENTETKALNSDVTESKEPTLNAVTAE